jgi:hypothetical protein
MKLHAVVIIVLSYCAFGQSSSDMTGKPILARVGNSVITEDEFKMRFELTPGLYRHVKTKLDEEKAVFLYSMIAEKLLAQEAKERGLDRDSTYEAGFGEFRKLFARDELYRRAIAQKVKITSEELQEAIRNALIQRQVEFIFFESKKDAQFVRRTIKHQMPLSEVLIDSTIPCVYDTATVQFGEANTAIETAAYQLKPGELSKVISAGDGYYLMRILSDKPNTFYNSMQPSVLQERVEQKIRLKKERVRFDEFVQATLKNKKGYARKEGLRAIMEILKGYQSELKDTLTTLSLADLSSLKTQTKERSADTLAVAGSTTWSVYDGIQHLCNIGYQYNKFDSRTDMLAKLTLQMQIWVQQELIAQEGLALGLDQSASVLGNTNMWNDYYLALRMKEKYWKDLTVSNAEVWRSLKNQDSKLVEPTIQLRELWTNSLQQMNAVSDSLNKGWTFLEAVKVFSEDEQSKSNDGLTQRFSIWDRTPIGEIAWKLNEGDRYGPICTDGEYLCFELVSKKQPAQANDSTFLAAFENERSNITKRKQRTHLSYYLAQSAQRQGFVIYEDRLKALEVSTVPMMAFRILGFGGRMFAAPFVDKQIEWLNIDPKNQKILP